MPVALHRRLGLGNRFALHGHVGLAIGNRGSRVRAISFHGHRLRGRGRLSLAKPAFHYYFFSRSCAVQTNERGMSTNGQYHCGGRKGVEKCSAAEMSRLPSTPNLAFWTKGATPQVRVLTRFVTQ